MKRVDAESLQRKAWDSGRPIEFDHEQGIAVLEVGGRTFYTNLAELEACS